MKKTKGKKNDMKNSKEIKSFIEDTEPIDFSNKQSIRTSFKLSNIVNEKLSRLAKYYRITKKELIDLICRDTDLAKTIAKAAKDEKLAILDKSFRKTYVISKRTLQILSDISKEYQIKRDTIVNYMVLSHSLLLDKKFKKHSKAFDIIREFEKSADIAENKLKQLLGHDDQILWIFGYVMLRIEDCITAIENELNNEVAINTNDY